MIATIAPLVGGLFFVFGIGALLRARRAMGASESDTLQRLVVDVTMPALLVHVLAARGLVWSSAGGLVGTTVALAVSGAVGFAVAALLGGDRRARGSAALTAAFCNTGFLGFPLILALFPEDAEASSTALMADAANTTLMLWTVGAAFATRMGQGSFDRRAAARVLVRPVTLAIPVGLALHAATERLPGPLDAALGLLGGATLPVVFLALGLKLDLGAVRARAGTVVAVGAVKLLVSPLVCLAVVRLIQLPEPVASVAVLEAAMPSALMAVVVSDRSGCDQALAVGVAGFTSALCMLTLPLVGALLAVAS